MMGAEEQEINSEGEYIGRHDIIVLFGINIFKVIVDFKCLQMESGKPFNS